MGERIKKAVNFDKGDEKKDQSVTYPIPFKLMFSNGMEGKHE